MQKNEEKYFRLPKYAHIATDSSLWTKVSKTYIRKEIAYSNGIGKVGLFTQKEKKKPRSELLIPIQKQLKIDQSNFNIRLEKY